MYQQINLYQPIFRKQRQIFAALTMVKASGVVAATLLAIYAYGLWQATGLEAEVLALEGREKVLAAQLAGIDPTVGAERRNEVERELAELNATLLGQQRLIDVLREQPLGTTKGFSGYLEALGRQHTAELWLTDFVIDGGTGGLDLAGRSLRAELVPEYLQRLGLEEAMLGQRFDVLTIERDEESSEVMFRVASRLVDTKGNRERVARNTP
jgi:hypothetical protein